MPATREDLVSLATRLETADKSGSHNYSKRTADEPKGRSNPKKQRGSEPSQGRQSDAPRQQDASKGRNTNKGDYEKVVTC